MNDADKMIHVFQILLGQMEAMLPQLVREDGRTENLNNQIHNQQTNLARIKNVLQKHKDHERRQREIAKQNSRNR